MNVVLDRNRYTDEDRFALWEDYYAEWIKEHPARVVDWLATQWELLDNLEIPESADVYRTIWCVLHGIETNPPVPDSLHDAVWSYLDAHLYPIWVDVFNDE